MLAIRVDNDVLDSIWAFVQAPEVAAKTSDALNLGASGLEANRERFWSCVIARNVWVTTIAWRN